MSPISVQLTADLSVAGYSPYDLKLGRLGLPTIFDDIKEAVGDTLETIGAGVVPGERRARPFSVTLPLHGLSSSDNPYDEGLRMRRQMRSLMDNAQARLRGLYLNFRADSELNGWVILGGGNIEYHEGGITTADFSMSLDDAYVVANLRTHKPARRLEIYDRRLPTVARDVASTIYSTDFATKTAAAIAPLQVGAANPLFLRTAVSPGVRATLDGDLPVVAAPTDRSTIHYDLNEVDVARGGVVILDRRGVFTPTPTLVGDVTPQMYYGWEEVYGQNFPLTEGDVPVIQNGISRVRWDRANNAFLIDKAVAGTGYVNVAAAYLLQGHNGSRYNQLTSVSVDEWVFERGRLKLILTAAGGARLEVYVTLENGSYGPRIEAYTTLPATALAVRVVPAAAGPQEFTDGIVGTAAATDPATGTVRGTYVGSGASTSEPWAQTRNTSTGERIAAAVLQGGLTLQARDDTLIYGATRKSLSLESATAGYLSVHVAPVTTANGAPAYSGLTDFWQGVLYDVRAIPELVQR